MKVKTAVATCVVVGGALISLRWPALLFGGIPMMVGSVVLFIQQDFRPWSESTNDLAVTRLDARVLVSDPALTAMAARTRGDGERCADFAMRIEHAPAFSVNANTYCKIRFRTTCTCQGGAEDRRDSLFEIYVTRGSSAGRIGGFAGARWHRPCCRFKTS